MKEGDEVVVHYTVKGTEKTAQEVDHVGKDGMKATVVAVKSVGSRRENGHRQDGRRSP